MSEPTGGWTDAWPRWALHVLTFIPGIMTVLFVAMGLIRHIDGFTLVGGCLVIPSILTAMIGSYGIEEDKLGYLSLSYVNRRQMRLARREARRKERRAKRICRERGIHRLNYQYYGADVIWKSWEETLANADAKLDVARQLTKARLTPQELFVKGDITMEDLERLLSHSAVGGDGHA